MVPVTSYNGIDYSLVYNFDYYINNNQDKKAVFTNDDIGALAHFVTYGRKEGRVAKDSFNVHRYKEAYYDLRNAFGNNLPAYYNHYINYGYKEGRQSK